VDVSHVQSVEAENQEVTRVTLDARGNGKTYRVAGAVADIAARVIELRTKYAAMIEATLLGEDLLEAMAAGMAPVMLQKLGGGKKTAGGVTADGVEQIARKVALNVIDELAGGKKTK
jgi:hypothetical protein